LSSGEDSVKLNELPGYHVSNDGLSDNYVEELRAVDSEEKLFEFVQRWSALWEIGRDRIPEILHPGLDRIVGHKFDAEEALQCIAEGRKKGCKHAQPGESCPGMNIVMPPTLLMAEMVSRQFGAPICTALHQMFCKDENHLGCF
jgi:hypothetical protein